MRAAIVASCMLLLLYCGLVAVHSIPRDDHFSPDSMNYVDVARHIAAGDGVVQSALGYNQPDFDPEAAAPAPMISQGPVYPLTIAALASTGLAAPRAALAVAWVGYVATLVLAFYLARAMFDVPTAWLYLAVVASYHPLREVSTWAWSESLACVWLLSALCLVATASARRGPSVRTRFWWAGVCAGLAFATRYAFAPIVAVVWIGAALAPAASRRRRGVHVAMAALGSLIPVGAVLTRNLLVRGRLFEPALPSTDRLDGVLAETLRALLRWHLNLLSPDSEIALFVLLLVLATGMLVLRRRSSRANGAQLFSGQRALPVLWVVGYVGLLVFMKLRVDLDHVGERLIAPAGLVLLLPWTALLGLAAPALRRWSTTICAMTLALLVGGQLLGSSGGSSGADAARHSPRNVWIAEHARPTDFLLGNSMEEVAFWLGPRPMATVSPYPSSRYLDYAELLQLADSRPPEQDRSLLVLLDEARTAAAWAECYGPFLASLVHSAVAYPRLLLLERGEGFWAWEIRPGP